MVKFINEKRAKEKFRKMVELMANQDKFKNLDIDKTADSIYNHYVQTCRAMRLDEFEKLLVFKEVQDV
jgi:hypothetical protein